MPLDTIVKTVLMHDGPFDEADRFLLRAPATDYIENLHFHRQGNLQKRNGNEEIATVPNANGEPFLLHSIGEGLHVLTEDGARSYNGSDWNENNVAGFVGTSKMDVETPPVGGMGHIDMFLAPEHYIVVYEVRERSSSSTPAGWSKARVKHVVVQSYDRDGNFLHQARIEDARSPKLLHATFRTITDFVTVMYQSTKDEALLIRLFDPATGGISIGPSPVHVNPDQYFGMECHGTKDDVNYGPMSFTRLGASSDGQARYHVAWDSVNQTYIVLFQQGGALKMVRVNTDYSADAEVVLFLASAWTYEAFDIVMGDDGNVILLYGLYKDSADRDSRAIVEKREPTGSFAQQYSAPVRLDIDVGNADFYGRTYNHGGLATDGNGNVSWLIHDAGEAVYDQFDHVRDRNTGLHYGLLDTDGVAQGTDRFLPHHRLASRPAYYFDKLYAAVQQWHDTTPYTESVAGFGGYTSTLGSAVPRTTVVAVFDQTSNVVRPVACLDSGKSKTQEYSESEWSVHMPRLGVDGDDLLVLNRVAIRVEDLSLNMSNIGGNDIRLGNAEAPADALCRIHRISKGVSGESQIRSAKFGDGLVIGTAIPLWFDGKFFGEFGPMEQPEIIDVRDDRMTEQNERPPLAFDNEDDSLDDTDWTKLQIVTGYYDATGNKHRSSPSSVVYVARLTGENPDSDPVTGFPEIWRGESVRVYFTQPLSALPADLEYFVEVYAGAPSAGSSLQLIDVDTINLSTIQDPDDLCVNVQLVRFLNASPTLAYGAPPRTSRSIYTDGGELPADPWPAFTESVVTSTRFFALDAVNKGKVLVSKRFQDFIAPEYNALLDINLGDERDLLCIGKMDDKTIIFEKDDIHVIYGDGPENNGQGEDFAVHYISTDVGCQDQESIVECPLGLVFFRKERGFYLLDRQLNIKYIGDKVHDLSKGIDVVAAELVSASGEVRFLCAVTGAQGDPDGGFAGIGAHRPPTPIRENKAPDSNFALVWDYEKDQWSVFANYPGAASTIHQGRYTRLLSDWSIWQEREEADRIFTDPTGDNRTLLRTPWIPLAENGQGYGRLHRMNILGRYFATLGQTFAIPFQYYACDIQVKIWYDYEEGRDVTPQTKLFKYQDFWFDPFSKRNLRAQRLQFAITPAEGRGRCQAVKLEFEELLPEDSPDGKTYALGQGFEISSIDFEIGVDQRVTRLLPQAVLK